MPIRPALVLLIIRPVDRVADEGEGADKVEGGEFERFQGELI